MVASGARSVLSGVIAGAGAWTAHTLSGGEVAPVAGLVALTVSVVLGPVVARPSAGRTVDPLRIAALMLLAQGAWHLVFMVGADAAHGAHAAHTAAAHAGPASASPATATWLMLGAHVLVAAVGAAVAVGLDRTVVRAASRIGASLLPRLLVRVWTAPTPATPAPVVREAPRFPGAARFLVVRVLRGPPVPLVSALRG